MLRALRAQRVRLSDVSMKHVAVTAPKDTVTPPCNQKR
jgi:hypothetical protein